MGDAFDICRPVPLFPLPNVVLLPRAVLPLHIFEERYKEMTADALRGERQIAMAMLRPGWEKSYHEKPAIEPVVCVGRILSHERLPDGKYNFLLQGHMRARIVREVPGRSYRLAHLQPVEQIPILEIDLDPERRRLIDLFSSGGLAALPLAGQFQQLLRGVMPTSDVADLLAFNFIEDAGIKQALLGEADPRRRVRTVIEQLESLCPAATSGLRGLPVDPSVN